MDPKIAQRYNDSILHEAMERFAIQKSEIKLLDGFESFLYEFLLIINYCVIRFQTVENVN